MQQRKSRLGVHTIRSLVLWTWIVFFATVSVAETTHHHAPATSSEQHCAICIAAHSTARPVQVGNVMAAPTRCVGFLFVAAPVLFEYETVLALYIRPPPVL